MLKRIRLKQCTLPPPQSAFSVCLYLGDGPAAMPELVVRNEDGSPETVAYHVLPSLLLNEFQKQNQELAATKADLSDAKSQIASMKADMDQMKQAMDRLMAALAPTTKFASAE